MTLKTQWPHRYTKTILRDVGLLLHVPGVMALASLPVCFVFREYYAIWPFLWTALVSLGSGQLLYRCFYKTAEAAGLRPAMLTVALGWGLIPLLGAIPLMAIATHLATSPEAPLTVLEFQHPWNAVFESYSGFTGTGLSVALRPSELPHSLQWWRSFTEWIGGVGVIVLVLSVLEPATDDYYLYHAEGREKKIGLTVTSTAKWIWRIYLLYTGLSVLLLRLVGMSWWSALNHGMTAIATGGFSVTDNSLSDYSSVIQLAVVPIMIAGAISFSTHYQLLSQGRLTALWQSAQHRALWLLLGVGTLVLLLENYWFRGSFLWVDTLFQWTSALTTCGLSTVKLQTWSPSAQLLLSLAMVFGAASGSTVGGLKLSRVVALYKGVLWRFRRISLRPHELMRYTINGEVLKELQANRRVEAAAILGTIWLMLLGVGVFTLTHVVWPQYDLSNVILEVASAQGNVGLSTGITHSSLHWVGKLTLILLMWMGRLEIIPVLMLLSLPLKPLRQAVCRRGKR